MATISLVTDSTSDVPADLAARYGIHVVPALLAIGDQSYRDAVDMTREAFYQRLATFNTLPTTGAPASGAFEAAYTACPPGPILSIHTAATLSGPVRVVARHGAVNPTTSCAVTEAVS